MKLKNIVVEVAILFHAVSDSTVIALVYTFVFKFSNALFLFHSH